MVGACGQRRNLVLEMLNAPIFFFFSNKVGVEREKVGVFIITHLFLPMIHNISNTIAFNGEWTSFIQERLRTVINPSYYLGRYELLVADWIIL